MHAAAALVRMMTLARRLPWMLINLVLSPLVRLLGTYAYRSPRALRALVAVIRMLRRLKGTNR
jgi:hypothetical protein